jgi:hypothetical protein
MSNERKLYTLQHLEKLTKDALENNNLPDNLNKSVSGITKIITSIINTKGEGWTAHMIDENGEEILTPTEKVRFEEEFKPYIRTILNYFNNSYEDEYDEKKYGGSMYNTFQQGGTKEEEQAKDNAKKIEQLKEQIQQLEGKKGATSEDSEQNVEFTPDAIFNMIMEKIGSIDEIVKKYAGDWGVLRLQRYYDETEDIQVIPQPLITLINGLTEGGFIVMGNILSEIKISFRVILFVVYLFFDIARIAAGLSNRDYIRKIMSIILSVLELLRGEWKKSILTFLGYFGTSPLLVGALLKIFLVTFQLMDPQKQETFLIDSFDTTKSVLIGFLLNIFQITAPLPVRLYLNEAFDKIRDFKLNRNTQLEQVGIEKRPEYLIPTFEDINNIQSIIADKAIVCSKKFQDAIADVYNNTIMRIILEIMRIPVSKVMRENICGEYQGKSFEQILKLRQENFNNYKKSLKNSKNQEQPSEQGLQQSQGQQQGQQQQQQKEEENNPQ